MIARVSKEWEGGPGAARRFEVRTIAVVGGGYVGLVVAACLADAGNRVICADVDRSKVDMLQRGKMPIYEPGLAEIVQANLDAGRLSFTTDVANAVRISQVVFIAVSTPPGEGGEADLSNVLDVSRVIGQAMDAEKVVVVKSTVPVGACYLVQKEIESQTEWPVHVCSNPEFLKEGAAVGDFVRPDRVVIGTDSDLAADVLSRLHAPFLRTGAPILRMRVASAEISKYASNAMLATRISFMNSIAALCEETGADVAEVRRAVGSDERIGATFLFPGIGYGGSCFPKDVEALSRTMESLGVDDCILKAVNRVNDRQKSLALEHLKAHFGEDMTGICVAIWGLAFKPGTDDMREAPSLVTVAGLLALGARVVAHDSVALDEARRVFGNRPGLVLEGDQYRALEGADALVIHTEWLSYRRPDYGRMRTAMARPLIFDGRNLYDPEAMLERGFEYTCIGRPLDGHRLSR